MNATLRFAALVAVAFGALTVFSGGRVLFGGGAAAAGDYVPFIVWFNFVAGFGYVLAGVGLWLRRRWSLALSAALAILTALAFAALGMYIAGGGAYEARTVAAMAVRTLTWSVIALIAWMAFRPAKRAASLR